MEVSKQILAYCLQDKGCLMKTVDQLESSYFEEEAEKCLFQVIRGYWSKYQRMISQRKLEQTISDLDLSAEIETEVEDLFEDLSDADLNVEDFDSDLDQFRDQHMKAKFTEVMEGGVDQEGNYQPGALEIAQTDPKKALEAINATLAPLISDIDNKGLVERGTAAEGMLNVLDRYEQLAQDSSKAYGIRTGYSGIDDATLGVKGGELMLIGGRPGQGKSIFLLNAAVNALKEGHEVMIISIEMPKEQYEDRLAACYANISVSRLQKGNLNADELRSFNAAREEIKAKAKQKQNLHIVSIPVATALTIEAEINRLEAKIRSGEMRAPQILIVDYLGIMQSTEKSGSQADWQVQGAVCEQLRGLARRRHIGIISAVQLNRDKQKGKGTTRIARSDIIAATADVFLQIEEEDDNEDALPLDDVLKIYIGKNRKGKNDISISLWKNFENMLIRNRDAAVPSGATMAAMAGIDQQFVIEDASEEEPPDMET